jgi:hypothetical protein
MPTKIEDIEPGVVDKRSLEVRIAALQGKLKESERRALHWHAESEKWQQSFDNLAAVKEPVERDPIVLKASTTGGAGVVFVNWSDWHVAEVVDPTKVNRLNAYNPEIARERAHKCANSTVRLWRHIRKSYSVDSMVLFLGGDFITGYLHDELTQTNAMAPVEETRFASQLLSEALTLIASEKSIKNLRIVGIRGNHGRTTKKMQFKNDYETSYESWLYWGLQEKFHDGKRILFDVPKSDIHVVDVTPSYRLRLYHGHQIKYNDGVGGLTIPLNKWQSKQDRIASANFNMMGHYHTYSIPNSTTILNGALKGFDEYAASHGFPFQEPLQTFALLDVERGIIAQHLPIFCA